MSRDEIFRIVMELARDHLGTLLQFARRRNREVPPESVGEPLHSVVLDRENLDYLQSFIRADIVDSLVEQLYPTDELVLTLSRRPRKPTPKKRIEKNPDPE